ncbi:hypothetical protein [Clostridium haemolyticum]|uniref:Uncharacterized protein n=1 Tax=Clostridium haemolyticum NCTC 9693 TaxID=1443114 RepID=A0ABR4TGY1_CLOHA|nr:hypothetical protein [Clostridium haemolyticum]KEI18243.1 hypothetical protein Z960_03730 [Clostridium haemolyticum NCTC 9693]KGN04165.1 hypothetical protein Z961_04225 [Clostridium haemolyticum NCTC 8350]
MHTKERLISLLPYYLENGENINKYYEVLSFFYDELIDVFNEIIDNRDINNAELYGLDIIGDIVGQKRTEKYKDDEKYRNRIKTRIMQNNSRGYIEDVNNLASAFLGENFIGIRQGYQFKDLAHEPAMLEVNLSSNKLKNYILDNAYHTLKCGTVNTGVSCLGNGMQSIPLTKQTIKKYKPIFIPELQSAVSSGVRLQYRINNNKETVKIKLKPNITFKDTVKKIKMTKNPYKITFKNPIEIIKIKSNPFYFKQNFLKCGITSISAKMGILL